MVHQIIETVHFMSFINLPTLLTIKGVMSHNLYVHVYRNTMSSLVNRDALLWSSKFKRKAVVLMRQTTGHTHSWVQIERTQKHLWFSNPSLIKMQILNKWHHAGSTTQPGGQAAKDKSVFWNLANSLSINCKRLNQSLQWNHSMSGN